jgi:uncharacterized protein YprB with RNaseH-like and TPR domain
LESRDAHLRRPASAGSRPADSDEIRRKIESLRLALVGKVPRAGVARGESGQNPASIEGAREIATAHGRCLLIEKDLRDCPSLEVLSRAYRALVDSEGAPDTGFAFLDLETTGLSATPLFLAGMLLERGGSLKAVQLLARDYSEERCLIDILDGLLGESRICVTFNGKSFDLPYLRERAKYHRLPLQARPEQLDLLHHARRRWKHSLPDCRLLTLEWYILGRRRMGDIGGWEVPCIYHEFVHTKDATRLKVVLRHNLMDVLAMAELLVSLAEA